MHIKNLELATFICDLDDRIKKLVYFSDKITKEESSEDPNEAREDQMIEGQDFSEKSDRTPENAHFNKDEENEKKLNDADSDEDEEWKDGGEGESDEDEKVDYETGAKAPRGQVKPRTNTKGSESKKSSKKMTTQSSKLSALKNENSKTSLKKDANKDDDEDDEDEKINKDNDNSSEEVEYQKPNSEKSISIKGDRKMGSEASNYNLHTGAFNLTNIKTLDAKESRISDMETLEKVRYYLQTNAKYLMGNILLLLTKSDDEKLACIVVMYYEIIINKVQMNKIISKNMYNLLKHIWRESKNYIEINDKEDSDETILQEYTYVSLIKEFREQNKEKDINQDQSHNSFFEGIKRKIKEKPMSLSETPYYIKVMSKWVFKCKDNFLKALLHFEYEEVALEVMGIFYHDMTDELLSYCLTEGKEIFLSKSLELSAFKKTLFRDPKIVEKFLELLKSGQSTNYYLNILTSIDIAMWRTNYIKELIEILEHYKDENHQNNQLMLSYNPLMTIALA